MTIEAESVQTQRLEQANFEPGKYIARTLAFARGTFPNASPLAQQDVAEFVSAFIASVESLKRVGIGQRDLIRLSPERVESDTLIRKIVLDRARFIGQEVIYHNGTSTAHISHGTDARIKNAAAQEIVTSRYACSSHPTMEIAHGTFYTETGWNPATGRLPTSLKDTFERPEGLHLALTEVEYVLVADGGQRGA